MTGNIHVLTTLLQHTGTFNTVSPHGMSVRLYTTDKKIKKSTCSIDYMQEGKNYQICHSRYYNVRLIRASMVTIEHT